MPRELPTVVREAFAHSLALAAGDLSPDDDFFARGGTSLTAALMLTDLENELKIEIPVTALIENPTPSRLASKLRAMMAPRPGGGHSPTSSPSSASDR
ncbi:acyl carrier protein [Pendulispora albinea]|uniref:Acyl carrier protein n=1 Tax=Pendulispora albinea TaxID=2741071 RepID=A0ABZ2M4X9_9BACT